ncbi:KOW domain-containing RNA-binding protein [Aneurinibacillus tyrosinisolvens]|jgi:large subunit ribosomal protein L14e|uniref:KOW domain-containing RNA-binding protein n=1 Tax=Aneurinibacillus tyrosinisolvens TaxID=1443435 RepID=UPI000B0CD011|nr:KOW domain-containing RNA-binding protein [Aneurinibacillus tyrosinisolvens]
MKVMRLTDDHPLPGIGQFVRMKQGRDAGKMGIIISLLDARYVMIADGDKRKFDRPKKKNILHLEPLNYFSDEVQQSLNETGRVSNAKLRYALNKYAEEAQADMLEKGD